MRNHVFCNSCGFAIKPGTNFCGRCGFKNADTNAPAPASAVAEAQVGAGAGSASPSSTGDASYEAGTFPPDSEATIYLDGRVAGYLIHVRTATGAPSLDLRWAEVVDEVMYLYKSQSDTKRPKFTLPLADVTRLERVDFDEGGATSVGGSSYASSYGGGSSSDSDDGGAYFAQGSDGESVDGEGARVAPAPAVAAEATAGEGGPEEELEVVGGEAAAQYGVPNEFVYRLYTSAGSYTFCAPDEQSLFTWLRVVVDVTGVNIGMLPASRLLDNVPGDLLDAHDGGSVPCSHCGLQLPEGSRFCGRCGMAQVGVQPSLAWGAQGGATEPRPFHPSRSDTDLAALAAESQRTLKSKKSKKSKKEKKKRRSSSRRKSLNPERLATAGVKGYKFKTFVQDAMVKPATAASSSDVNNEVALESTTWVPDHLANSCMMPRCRTKFTFKIRRHHCRLCGKVFCEQHSDQKLMLDNVVGADKSKPQRVCDTCFARVLSGGPSIKQAPEAKLSEEEIVRRKLAVVAADDPRPPPPDLVGRPRGMSILDEIDLLDDTNDEPRPFSNQALLSSSKTLPLRGEPGFDRFHSNLAKLQALGGGGAPASGSGGSSSMGGRSSRR